MSTQEKSVYANYTCIDLSDEENINSRVKTFTINTGELPGTCNVNATEMPSIRFTDEKGEHGLDYWIECWNQTGISKIWVKTKKSLEKTIRLYINDNKTGSAANADKVFDFFDDFGNGIWTKYSENPVMVRTQLWWESAYICEPTILYEEGIYKMWYMGGPATQADGVVIGASVGYATSKDGLKWDKYPGNPIVKLENDSVIRPHVLKYEGKYYLFAVDKSQWGGPPTQMRRWTSNDGLNWSDETIVMSPTQKWEKNRLCNPSVIVDEDGLWKMIYHNQEGPSGFGYAFSTDGIHWTKYEGNPVIEEFYGGDPYLWRIGDKYFMWYSREHAGSLRICCSWSTNMIDWHPVYNNPQIGYTQPWEHWVAPENGGSMNLWKVHITDAALVEIQGKVHMCYQGVQTPLGMATFNGSSHELAERMLNNPPLSKWAESPYGMVENNELKISDNETDTEPIFENSASFDDREGYVIRYRAKCYAGPCHRVQAVIRYIDEKNFARFWIDDNQTTYYQEFVAGVFTEPVNIGPNKICDDLWHEWKIIVQRERNELFIDGILVGNQNSTEKFINRKDLRIGFSVYDTYAAFKNILVWRINDMDCVCDQLGE